MTRRSTFVAQMEASECGAACLAMVLAHFGYHASLAELRTACGVSREGTSAATLLQVGARYGLSGTAHRVELDDLADGPFPAILHWEFDHFVVLAEVTARGLLVLDPALGPRCVPFSRADDAFTGVRLSFAPADDFQPKARRAANLTRYLRATASAWSALLLVGASALLLEVVGLVFPIASQVAIDLVIRPKQPRFLLVLGVVLLVALVLRFALAVTRNRVMAGLRAGLDTRLAVRFVEHLMRLPLGFFSQRSAGDLLARVQSHATIRDVVRTLSTTLLDALLVFSYSALMLAYNVRLGCVVIAVTLVRTTLTTVLQASTRDAVTSEIIAVARESSVVAEALTSCECVKAFGIEASAHHRYVDCSTDRFSAVAARQHVEQSVAQVLPLLDAIGLALVYWIGGLQVTGDKMTVGVLAAFVAITTLLLVPLRSVIGAAGKIPELRQLLKRMDDIWETPPERDSGADPGSLAGAIRLLGVGVIPAGGPRPVLEGIDFEVRAGERLAVVGPSGSGKSTLARLIAGLDAPTHGQVFLDGMDVGTLDPSKVRAQIGVVLPDEGAFAGTVRENIALANDDCPLSEIESAARHACIAGDLRALPGGYDCLLDGGGSRLSGGQRQRVALARALLKVPGILILDEATSSLDADLEQEIFANLATMGCTQIIITHRASAMRYADRILVLCAGRAVDHGRFDELARRCELFREMIHAQGEAHL